MPTGARSEKVTYLQIGIDVANRQFSCEAGTHEDRRFQTRPGALITLLFDMIDKVKRAKSTQFITVSVETKGKANYIIPDEEPRRTISLDHELVSELLSVFHRTNMAVLLAETNVAMGDQEMSVSPPGELDAVNEDKPPSASITPDRVPVPERPPQVSSRKSKPPAAKRAPTGRSTAKKEKSSGQGAGKRKGKK